MGDATAAEIACLWLWKSRLGVQAVAVFEVWWPRLAAQLSEWSANPETFLDVRDAVVVLGHYAGIAKEI